MQIDEADIGIKIPASYDSQPGKCLVFSFLPIYNSESFSIYVADQKPMLFSFDRNVFFEVSDIHIFISPFQILLFAILISATK